ncbi:receptor-type tyrosine-protein phosphatase eta-like isoform X2 [Brienomyrus brachyistius]|uniref:receptor-type tyrosine-protein phosphatase eta-like isoform X2 n=1 Tax=Brienomyrus brachyistius TaxID=42636 RepID=UPI0020B3587E|nr:receptor-type tyrosine-protein phosphatase eta-like isoform X2 [Brienomyrus brachyistius]
MSTFYIATRMMRRPSLPCVALTAVLLFAVFEGVKPDTCTPCTDFKAQFVFPSFITVSTGNCTIDPKVNGGNFSYSMSVTCAPNNASSYINSYNFTNVTLGENYKFNINASFGNVNYPVTLYSYTYVNPLTNLRVVNKTTGSIGISWDLQPNVSSGSFSYYVSYNNSTFNTTSKSALLENLQPATSYNISVMIVVAQGTSQLSVVDFTKPDVIRNLTITAISTTSVSLSWAPPVGNAAFYSVLWNDSSTQQNTTSLNTSITISNLTAGNQYTFSITPIAGDNQTAGAPISLSQYTRPDVIRNLIVTVISPTSVSLSWVPPVGNAAFYSVLWNASSTQQNTTSLNTSITISNLTAGTQYTFSVTAIAGDNQTAGGPMSVSHFTRPDIIRNLTVTVISPTSVSLSWAPPVGNAAFYSVLWNASSTQQNTTSLNTSITISNLTAGTQYTFSVTAIAGDNQTAGAPISLSQYTRPDVIRNLTITAISTTSVSLSWAPPVGNAAFYSVLWNDNSTQQNTTSLNTSITISDLTAGTQYTFRVTAMAGDNQTAGAPMSVSHFTRPDVIRNLTITAISTTSVSLSWAPPVGNAAFYSVLWNDNSTQQNATSLNTFITISNLTAGTQYTFSVTAIAGDNQTAGAPISLSQYNRPDVIRNLTITAISTTSVSLSWAPPVGNAAFYSVLWNDNSTQQNTTSLNTFITISNLTAGTQYTFRVTAMAGDNQTAGAPMSVSHFTRPDIIRNLTVTVISPTSVSLSWAPPVGNAAFYSVLWNASSTQQNTTSLNTSITISNLTAGTQYTFSVTAIAGDNQTAGAPISLSQYTRPDVIRNLTITAISTTSVSLSWAPPVGNAAFYSVLWNDNSTQQNTTSLNTFITISNLTAGTQYTFRVTAMAGDNQTAGAPMSVSHFTRPDIIRNLTVTVISPTSVSLSWAPPVGNAAFYSVLWNASSTQQNTTSLNTSITISNLTAGTQYTFSVTAIAGDNQTAGAPISLSQYTRPDVIRNLTIIAISTTSVSLSWAPPVGNAAFYSVLWNDSSTQQNTTSLNTSITISNLTAGTQYTFSVNAMAGDNQTAGAPMSVSHFTSESSLRMNFCPLLWNF